LQNALQEAAAGQSTESHLAATGFVQEPVAASLQPAQNPDVTRLLAAWQALRANVKDAPGFPAARARAFVTAF
jgi:hypothetical protein